MNGGGNVDGFVGLDNPIVLLLSVGWSISAVVNVTFSFCTGSMVGNFSYSGL